MGTGPHASACANADVQDTPPSACANCAAGAQPSGWAHWRVLGRPWQDVMFSIGQIVFLVSLVPLLLSDHDVPALTALATAGMLTAFLAAHVSYRNWFTVAPTAVTVVVWALIGFGVHFG